MPSSDCGLSVHLGGQLGKLPVEVGESLDLSAENIPALPDELATSNLSIQKTVRVYSGSTHNRVDLLQFHAKAETFRLLGLALLSKVFHRVPRQVRIHLLAPESHIRQVILNYDQVYDRHNLVEHYYQWPDKFTYIPREADFFGRNYADLPDWAKPEFDLTNTANVMVTDDDWQRRDVLRCAGSEYGNILFAELLLNTIHPPAVRPSIDLETDIGFGGLARGSAEVELIVSD